ncbi:MAG: hypothetical protein JW864_03440 [Spirochaetes bacterium]|nr:hypothetical protein [Spirochaetota bacterium]
MKKFVILLILLLTASCSSLEKKRFEKANIYINSHPKMDILNRMGLLEGIIILGMNPCESIAAVGEPYSMRIIKKDPKLPSDMSSSDIIQKQCSKPDNTRIIFYFNNAFQYGNTENYSVIYVKGEAVKIDRGDVYKKNSGE